MAGHVARKGNRWYAVVYDGTDPQTGRERRRWHPAGTDRAAAEQLADRLATDAAQRRAAQRTGLTLEAFVRRWWLPAKQRRLSVTTLDGYGATSGCTSFPSSATCYWPTCVPNTPRTSMPTCWNPAGSTAPAGCRPRPFARSTSCYARSVTTSSAAES